MNLQFLPLPVLDLRQPVRQSSTSLHDLSKLASQIVHLSLSWASWTPPTRRAAQPPCISAQGWMSFSTAWRATLLFREYALKFYERQPTMILQLHRTDTSPGQSNSTTCLPRKQSCRRYILDVGSSYDCEVLASHC